MRLPNLVNKMTDSQLNLRCIDEVLDITDTFEDNEFSVAFEHSAVESLASRARHFKHGALNSS